jgi:hypothetical protein
MTGWYLYDLVSSTSPRSPLFVLADSTALHMIVSSFERYGPDVVYRWLC